MKRILPVWWSKVLSIYLGSALIAVTAFASPAEAMFIPTTPQNQADQSSGRSTDLGVIQRTLESKTLGQRLVDYGLSPKEALEKINRLSDDQVHQLAANISALQAGSHSIDSNTLIIILLLVLLIVILVQNTTGAQANWA
ncbi:MAG: PA2779 family protein [Betaproteobacteria bacterium]